MIEGLGFIEALALIEMRGGTMRRAAWQDGIVAYINNGSSKWPAPNRYLATCHVAACELGGVREIDDIMAEDWIVSDPPVSKEGET